MNKTASMVMSTLALGLGSTALAQNQPSAGLLNDWLRSWDPVSKDYDIGGHFRVRYEDHRYMAIPGVPGAVDFRESSPDTDNNYWLFRTRFHVGTSISSWASVYAEGQDSFSSSDDRNPDLESDRIDLYQAWFTIGNPKVFPLTAKLGRQELSYGDERLIGAFEWNNLSRVFDAVKLRYQDEDFWADGFVSQVVIPDDNNFNMSNEYDTFSGVYAGTSTMVKNQETHAYFLARNASLDSPALQTGNLVPLATPRDIYTLGTRWKSSPRAYGNWDYTLEGVYQWGRFKETAGSSSLDHEAFAGTLNVGYTLAKTPGKPRLALEYNYASGDDDPLDGKHRTFENLFPTNHKFYGAMDFFSWQNMHNGRLNFSVQPHKGVSVSFDVNSFWLADDRDFFYQANGQPRNGSGYGRNTGAGKYVGTELGLVVTYSPDPALQVQIGSGRFFVGDYPSDTFANAGGAHDASWAYGQLRFNF